MLNKTDFKILEFCSSKYMYLSALDIAKNIDLHITTVSDRLKILQKRGYLIGKKSGKGSVYRFSFNSENARKLRLFLDIDFVSSLNIDKINEFIKTNRGNSNILCCLLYGSSLETKNFNDIDLLVIYDKEKIEADIIFDLFQMDVKTFRNLYSIGEPRLQAALTTGRILIDRDFIFNYFENDLPIKTSEDLIYELKKKYDIYIKSIQALKKPAEEELRGKILEALKTKAVMEFASKGLAVPPKTAFQKELSKINPELNRVVKKITNLKGVKPLWDIFYSEIT